MIGMKASDFGLKVSRSYSKYDLCFCPFHNDLHPSASFYHETCSLYCFTCAKSFQLVDILKVTNSTSFSEFEIKELLDKIKSSIHMKNFETNDNISRIVNSFPQVGSIDNEINEIAVSYLERRNISVDVATFYGLRANEDGIVFPQKIDITASKVSGFVERIYAPKDKTQRYFKHGELEIVWPLKKVCDNNAKYLFLSEGPFKAMRIYKMLKDVGINDFISVCSFGLKDTQVIFKLLSQFNKTVIVVGDNDKAGKRWATKFKTRKNFFPFSFVTPFDEVESDVGVSAIKKMISIVEGSRGAKVFDVI